MEHYVGLDVSLKLTAICIVDQTGRIEREGVVASNPEAIAIHQVACAACCTDVRGSSAVRPIKTVAVPRDGRSHCSQGLPC
jgi:hypothetical protein